MRQPSEFLHRDRVSTLRQPVITTLSQFTSRIGEHNRLDIAQRGDTHSERSQNPGNGLKIGCGAMFRTLE